MSLAFGLAWIIFGACYIAYKYYNEELRMSPLKSLVMIVLGFVGFFILSWLASGLQWLEDNMQTLHLIIITPVAIGGCLIVGWLIFGDVKDAVKDDLLQGEIRQSTSTNHDALPSVLEKRARAREFRRWWFFEHDELLTLNTAEKKLENSNCIIVVTQEMIGREADIERFEGFDYTDGSS